MRSPLTQGGSHYTTPPLVREPGMETVREKAGGESARWGWKQRSAEYVSMRGVMLERFERNAFVASA